ncbi:hypothetical protein DEA06_13545 [Microbacterium sp. Gd 4-13]|uniref:exonuclease domain-containing protein n=1 Tax=Microbacterium sp. Gd 4-13 TaxID=2173179 RepID=UPI000D5666D2|nr:exonuclease domain-containing protein [Microbacterium sp. Gd 4-13]PVW03530.1 hypothetical protein DEA06_13545 [Microbacterium sp. Gd 4-13]
MSLDFVAIDFETANRSRASVCAVGAVRVHNGAVVDTFRSLVKPPEEFDEFEPINVSIHGIEARHVAHSPSWPEVYQELRAFIGADMMVCHNAQFDVSVLVNACSAYDIDWPAFDVACTLRLARAALTLPSYTLPWVSDHLGVDVFDHHDPLADAQAAAAVLIALARREGVRSVRELNESLGTPIIPTSVREPADSETTAGVQMPITPINTNTVGFADAVVCFTGALEMMVRDEARRRVVDHGGAWQGSVTKTTSVLVTGGFNLSTFRPGAMFSKKVRDAMSAVERGQSLEIITEDEFLRRLALSDEELAAARVLRSRVPEWVVTQAGDGPGDDYWGWFNSSLLHPDGRAAGEETCIWCATTLTGKEHWTHRDRHVCGIHCNERFKRAARRAWRNAGLNGDAPPDSWTDYTIVA